VSSNDFNTVKESLQAFLTDKNTKTKLSHILDKGTNDWEKWLQIEFEYYLEHILKYKARREVRATADQRHQTGRQHMFVDLIFRKQRTRLDKFIYLEFKLGKRPTALINNMWKDLLKNDEIVSSHFKKTGQKRRSVWSIGFYRDFSPLSVKRADEALDQHYSPFYSIHHEPVWFCKCRGKNHDETCHKVGMVIIGCSA